jgi:ABC-2 type transport system permease protein
VGLAAFLPNQLADDSLPTYGDIYGFISAVILLFVMFVAPEALCPDRRSGVLSLYLAAPLTRARYLAAKAAAVGTALLAVTLGPPLLLLVGLSLQSAGPDGPGDVAVVLLRIFGAGVMLAAFYTALSLAVSSLTDRRAVAAAGTFIFVQATDVVASVLVLALKAPDWLYALSLGGLPFQLGRQIHGEPSVNEDITINVATTAVACVLWTVAAGYVAWRRYRALQVTR